MNPLASQQLVAQFRGPEDAQLWSDCAISNPGILASSGREILASVPPALGYCVLLSATWASILRQRHAIPAIAVVGDLSVDGRTIFSATEHPPDGTQSGLIEFNDWPGHCWIEVGGYIGDISIFRTAYAAPRTHPLSCFVLRHFGPGKGILLATPDQASELGFSYTSRSVLTDLQNDAFVAGLGHLLNHEQ